MGIAGAEFIIQVFQLGSDLPDGPVIELPHGLIFLQLGDSLFQQGVICIFWEQYG